MSAGSEEATISNRMCMAEATLLTFCPPGPLARIEFTSSSSSGRTIFLVTASITGTARQYNCILK